VEAIRLLEEALHFFNAIPNTRIRILDEDGIERHHTSYNLAHRISLFLKTQGPA